MAYLPDPRFAQMGKNFKFVIICIIIGFLFTLTNCIFDYFGKVRVAKAEEANAKLEQKYKDTETAQRRANDELARITSELIANRQQIDSLHRYGAKLQASISATAASYAAIKKALEKRTNYSDSTKTSILNSLPK